MNSKSEEVETSIAVISASIVEVNEPWLDSLIEQIKVIVLEHARDTFKRYRECGKLVLNSGYEKGKWKSKHRKYFIEQLKISQQCFSQMVQLGEMTEEEFTNAVSKFVSFHAWANPAKLRGPMSFEPLPEGMFNIVYADPPWLFRNKTDFSPDEHYQTLESEDIKRLGELLTPTIKIAEDAVLFLWTPNAILPEALEVMAAWGFEYKSNIVWFKKRVNMGYWVYNQTELLLIGKRGEFLTPLEENKQPNVIDTRDETMERHSEKPEEAYELIERLFPNGKYLELFARNRRENWASWGLEIGKDLSISNSK